MLAMKCECREKIKEILSGRIISLEKEVKLADSRGNYVNALEARARRNEAQLILNTIILEGL